MNTAFRGDKLEKDWATGMGSSIFFRVAHLIIRGNQTSF
jgi:hypothetical protein